MAYPCANPTLACWAIDRDCQYSVRNIVDRPFPVPPRNRRSKDRCWLDIAIRNRLALDRARVHRRGGTFPRRSKSKVHRLRDAIAVHQIRKLDLDLDAVGIGTIGSYLDSSVMPGGKFGESGGRLDPAVGGNKELEVVGLHGDRLNTSEVRILVVEEVRSVRSSQGVVIERIEQVPDDRVGLIWTRDTRLVCAVAAVSYRAVLVRVQEPHGIVEGKVLKGLEATSGNAPQTPLGRGTVREG